MRRNGRLPLDPWVRGRVLAAWFLSAPAAHARLAVGTPLDVCLCRHDGKRYAVITAAARIVAVYQVGRTGKLVPLAEWPAAVETYFPAGLTESR